MNKRRVISVTGIAVMLAMIFFACKEEVPVSGVTLDKTALTLTFEETAVLKATVEPANATVQTVTWSVKPAGVVTLKADGNSCTLAYAGDGTATVTVKTADGGKTAQCRVTAAGALTNLALIAAVEQATGIDWTKEKDGKVKLTAENLKAIRAVTELSISDQKLTDLSGIEWFRGLTYLNCCDNQLTTLDVSANTALTQLYCFNNQLTSLDVSANTALTQLYCFNNQLTSLDVSGCTALEELYCYDNQLTSLDVSANTALIQLYCFNNQLTSLDITKLTALKAWYCGLQTSDGTAEQDLKLILTEDQYLLWKDRLGNTSDNKRVTVKVTDGTVTGVTLDYTECRLIIGDPVTLTATVEPGYAADKTVSWSVNPEGMVRLETDGNSCTVTAESTGTATVTVTTADGGKTAQCTVTVYDANTMINLSFIAAVEKATDIGWDKNDDGTVSLTDANLEKIRAVTELNISDQKLTDLSGIEWFTGLTTLYCDNNQLTELDVSANTALTSLDCYDNQLTSLDVSANTALKFLSCQRNQLTELNVSGCTALTSLRCYNNQLTELNVSANTALKTLWCYDNQLTELNVSANTALKDLECYNNQLTELDVKANTKLTSLKCDYNQLTKLDVSANTALWDLECSRNQLTELDVSANTALTSLYCSSNQLTELDVSANTKLTSLHCSSNQLTSLDVSANTALMLLYCDNNQLTELDVSANTALSQLYCSSNQLTELDVSAITELLELRCGNQTSDGTTPKSLDLFLTVAQMRRWEMWKSNINNGNVNASVTQ